LKISSTFGDQCPQNGSKNDPGITLEGLSQGYIMFPQDSEEYQNAVEEEYEDDYVPYHG